VDAACLLRLNRALFVNGVAGDVQDAAQCGLADGHLNRRAGVFDGSAPHEALCRVHRNGTHCVFAKVLRHFKDKAVAVVVCRESVQDLWQVIFELHVNDGADDLSDFADCICHVVSPGLLTALPRRK